MATNQVHCIPDDVEDEENVVVGEIFDEDIDPLQLGVSIVPRCIYSDEVMFTQRDFDGPFENTLFYSPEVWSFFWECWDVMFGLCPRHTWEKYPSIMQDHFAMKTPKDFEDFFEGLKTVQTYNKPSKSFPKCVAETILNDVVETYDLVLWRYRSAP